MIDTILTFVPLTGAIGAAIGAVVAVLLMSFVPEPARQKLNAIIVAGAGAVYMNNGGLGVWEYLFTIVATLVAFGGLNHYRFIALAWVMHSLWDIAHHVAGNPILPAFDNSSFGCMVFDFTIAIWFWFGAPEFYRRSRRVSEEKETVS